LFVNDKRFVVAALFEWPWIWISWKIGVVVESLCSNKAIVKWKIKCHCWKFVHH